MKGYRITELDLARKLGVPDDVVTALESSGLLEKTPTESFDPEKERGLPQLARALQLALRTKEKYASLGIPEEVFYDSFQDIAIWTRTYYERTGDHGLGEWGWIQMSLDMKVLRLGRLQFEPNLLEKDIRAGEQLYLKGTPVLHVHIPAEAPLDPKAVEDSLRRAIPFFRQYFGKTYDLLHCHSWLLSPALKELLPENSRILQFQSLFQVYATEDERQAEERVFGVIRDDFTAYPEESSLQKLMKAYLMAGNKVGVGLGVIQASAI